MRVIVEERFWNKHIPNKLVTFCAEKEKAANEWLIENLGDL